MSKLKKCSITLVFVICLLCVFLCGSALAEETDNGVAYTETPVYIDGLLTCRGYVIGGNSYVSLDDACTILGYDTVSSYDEDINTLTVELAGITVTVGKSDEYLCANGRYLYLPDGYMEVDGSFIIPTEALGKIFTLAVAWDSELEAVTISTADEQILQSGDEYYNEEDLYWLSRIITWESGNQPIEGQIAVGNVVINRTHDSRFSSTIKGVIFQSGQFSPVATGAIYGSPYGISVIAAKLALEGYNTIGNALFFQVGRYWGSDMISVTWIGKIGDHNFFV